MWRHGSNVIKTLYQNDSPMLKAKKNLIKNSILFSKAPHRKFNYKMKFFFWNCCAALPKRLLLNYNL